MYILSDLTLFVALVMFQQDIEVKDYWSFLRNKNLFSRINYIITRILEEPEEPHILGKNNKPKSSALLKTWTGYCKDLYNYKIRPITWLR